MTLTVWQIALYAGALLVLFLTPGPVWVAVIARGLANGFPGTWPLALGVVVGDVLWPLVAVFGLSVVVSVYSDFLVLLRYGAALVFLGMGAVLIRHRHARVGENTRLTAPGAWAGFLAGMLVILGNPKAILFYMGVLPGFFDLTRVTGWDIAAICAVSALVPFCGNLLLGLFLSHARAVLNAPTARARLNLSAGVMMVLVALVIVVF